MVPINYRKKIDTITISAGAPCVTDGPILLTQLLQVMDDFSKFFEDKKSFDVIYLDFRKAFDTVPHQRLLTKLEAYGFNGNLLKWIESFLTGRSQYIRVGQDHS